MKNKGKRKKEKLRGGKIGSGYMMTMEGQPSHENMVELTTKKDHEVRPNKTKK